MALELRSATPSDASCIADIHMAAFGRNPLLLAQFPTPETRHQLRSCIAEKAVNDIRDPNIIVLVVRDQEDRVVSFAKWSLPVSAKAAAMGLGVEAPWVWPEGTNFGVLDVWTDMAEGAKRKALGDRPAYNLTFIGTDPQHERRGAATALIRWGLEKSKREGIPAYLESTPNAAALYERLGFRAVDRLSIILNESTIYEEICYVAELTVTSLTTSTANEGERLHTGKASALSVLHDEFALPEGSRYSSSHHVQPLS